MQGRDLTYVLPPHAVRVLSMVPADAPDIRDSAALDFGRIESLTFRAGAARDRGAGRSSRSARLMTLLALVALARRVRRARPRPAHG